MTPEQHRQRHIELHKALDQLFDDFIQCNPQLHSYTLQPILALIDWSHQQTITPDDPNAASRPEEKP